MTLVVNSLNRYTKYWLALVGLAFLLMGCESQKEIKTLEIKGGTMGTYYVVKVAAVADQLPDGEKLKLAIDAELESVNDALSHYRKTSEISRFNRFDKTDAFPISESMRVVTTESLRISELSGGAFEPTIGPLVNLWGFGPTHRPEKIPSEAEINQARAVMGYQKLNLTKAGLAKSNPEIKLNFSAIAKGFGVDRVAELLAKRGFDNYLVEIGGELRLKGHNDSGKSWRIAVEKPAYDGSQAISQVIEPGDKGVATSGDYRNYFEEDGVRYSHTIDPVTGRPITNKVISVTVVTDTCMTADGLATAFTVMGVEKSLAYAEAHNLAVMIIEKSADGFIDHYSTAFKPLMIH
jgi:thiamine biosynthesis lipoprotein